MEFISVTSRVPEVESPRPRPTRRLKPLQMPSAKVPKSLETIGGDRRCDRRYDIRLEVRWELLRREKTKDSGLGYTVDLSSRGVLVETGRKLPAGLKVRLSIAWPVLLHNTTPLQLYAEGRVIRSDNQRAAIRIGRHELRAAGISAGALQVSCEGGLRVRSASA
jgi:hypothetical protein